MSTIIEITKDIDKAVFMARVENELNLYVYDISFDSLRRKDFSCYRFTIYGSKNPLYPFTEVQDKAATIKIKELAQEMQAEFINKLI